MNVYVDLYVFMYAYIKNRSSGLYVYVDLYVCMQPWIQRPTPYPPTLARISMGVLGLPATSKSTAKKQASQNHTNLKNTPLDAKYSDLLMPFGPPFLINFRDHLNVLNCNM